VVTDVDMLLRAFSLNPKLAHEADCGYEDRRVRISIVARSLAPQKGRIHFRRLLLQRLCSCSNAADHTFWVTKGLRDRVLRRGLERA